MSKDIILRRNDGTEGKPIGVQRLQTGGDWGAWVPEDETSKTGEITINQNGRYPAYRSGMYGFHRVVVDVQFPQSGTTRSGVDYTVDVDAKGKPHLFVTR